MINQYKGDKYYCDRCGARILMRESYRVMILKHFFFPRLTDLVEETVLCEDCHKQLRTFIKPLLDSKKENDHA